MIWQTRSFKPSRPSSTRREKKSNIAVVMTAVLRAKQGLPQRRDWNLPEGLEAFGTAALRAELGVANGPDPGA